MRGNKVRGWILETSIALVIFAAAAMVADQFVSRAVIKAFVEWETTPVVMMACGRGFVLPASESPALVEFQMRRRPALSCADIADDRPPAPPFRIALSERYGLYGAALALRLGGISWRSLDAYMGCLFGLSMVFAYLLFRLFASRVPALLGVVALICSSHLLGLATFRDYGKEPCFLALWLTLGWLWRRNAEGATRKILLPAAVGGAVLGWSLGFRPDVLVCVPAFAAVIVLAVRGFRPRDLALKAAALAVAAVTFVMAGWPVLSSMASGGNNSAHVIVLGLTTSFNRTLALEPALFDIGNTYSDGYAYALIAAHATLVQHEPQPVVFASTRYDQLGIGLLSDLASRFPADVVTRALGATIQVLKYPFDPVARFGDLHNSDSFVQMPRLMNTAETIGSVLDSVQPVVLWLAFAVLLIVSMRDWRVGVAAALLVLYFCGYSMLQFSRRHTFHLDVIAIGLLVIALEGIVWVVRQSIGCAWFDALKEGVPDRRRLARMLAGAAAAAVAAGLLAASIVGTRAWQQRHVAALLDRTLGVQWEDLSTPVEPFAATILRRGGVTAAWEVEYAANRDLWSTAVLFRVPPPAFSQAALVSKLDYIDTSYLQVEIGSAGCRVPSVLVGLKYTAYTETAHREFTRVFDIQPAGGDVTRLLVPAFYIHGTYWGLFDGFAVPAAAASCVTAIRRATSSEAVPLPILVAVLAPAWRTSPLYERLKDLPEFARLR